MDSLLERGPPPQEEPRQALRRWSGEGAVMAERTAPCATAPEALPVEPGSWEAVILLILTLRRPRLLCVCLFWFLTKKLKNFFKK